MNKNDKRTAPDAPGALVHFDILLADEFVLTELAGIADVLMIANRVTVRPAFSWTYLSLNGGAVSSRTGVTVDTHSLPARPVADYLFVLGSSNPDCPALSVASHLPRYISRGAQAVLLAEAASRYIAEKRPEAGRMTTHWENTAVMREKQGTFDVESRLAVEDGAIVTCAGMEATVDVALEMIGRHVSSAVQMTVADILLHDQIRDFATTQPYGGQRGAQTGDRDLDDCIEMMSANIEEPLPIQELVKLLGISNRSLERKFRTLLSTTPNNYYRELRMAKANNLLMNTNLSVYEVGLACGFGSGFSSLYKSFFNVTPLTMRRQRQKTTERG